MTIQVPIEYTMNMVMYMESYVIIYLAITDLFSAFLFVLTAFLLAATICCSTHFSHTFHFCNWAAPTAHARIIAPVPVLQGGYKIRTGPDHRTEITDNTKAWRGDNIKFRPDQQLSR